MAASYAARGRAVDPSIGYNPASDEDRDLHVESNRPLLAPAILLEELPLGEAGSQVVSHAREEIIRILAGEDDRLFVVVGPCLGARPGAALDYARRLRTQAAALQADLRV